MNRILLFLVFLSTILNAQDKKFDITHLDIESGLAHNTVSCIFKDSEGYMWIGTSNGLSCFTGAELTTYRNDLFSNNTLAGNKISTITEDNNGNIWIGTAGLGISVLDKRSKSFTNYSSYDNTSFLTSDIIHKIKNISDTIWICSANGLAYFDSKSEKFYTYPQHTLYPVAFYDIIKTHDNNYYVATNENCFYEFNPKNGNFSPICYKRDSDLTGNYKKQLFEDGHGNLWISAYSHGIVKYNKNNGKSEVYTENQSTIPFNLVNGAITNAGNFILFSTEGNGIINFIPEKQKFQSFKIGNFNKLDNLSINSLLIDSDGIIWLGTFNDGIYICNPNQIKFAGLPLADKEELKLENISVLSLYEDSRKQLWVGTDGEGIFRYSDGQIKHFHSGNTSNISSDRIICISENIYGELMFGTYMGGLMIYNPLNNQFRNYRKTSDSGSGISSNNVWSMLPDSNKIWLGLLGTGLDLFDLNTDSVKNMGPYSNSLDRINHNNVLDITKDRNGNILFATEGAGISIKEKSGKGINSFISINTPIKATSNIINSIYEGSEGELWIGTENGGLNRLGYRSNEMSHYSKNDGLPSNIINSITEDDNNNIWLGTAYGISKLQKDSVHFINYGIKDGMPGLICNRNAICKTTNGNLVVGTTGGLFMFHPDSVSTLFLKVSPILTDLIVQNRKIDVRDTLNGQILLKESINYTKEVTLPSNIKAFSIAFDALCFTLPEQCLYKYKLEGFDDHWNKTNSTQKIATYTNLSPGTYTFSLMASNSDGIWSNKVKSITIKILPSFWQTFLFKALVFTLFTFLFFWFYKVRIKKRELKYLREKEVQEQKILLLEKEKLETELNNQTFGILNRNKLLLNHKSRLSMLKNMLDSKNQKTVKKLITEIDGEINEEKDWKHIEPRLDKVYNNFMTILKDTHPELTQNELRVAAYVRMGLSSKEITEIMQKTLKAVDSDRYRLRKKLGIPQNGSLKKYLLELK